MGELNLRAKIQYHLMVVTLVKVFFINRLTDINLWLFRQHLKNHLIDNQP